MDNVLNAQIRELCGMMKEVDERIDGGVLQLFGHVRIAKRMYIGVSAGRHSVGG